MYTYNVNDISILILDIIIAIFPLRYIKKYGNREASTALLGGVAVI